MGKVVRLFCFACKFWANIVETFPHRLPGPPRKSNLERRFAKDFEVYSASKLIMLIRLSKILDFSRSRTVIRPKKSVDIIVNSRQSTSRRSRSDVRPFWLNGKSITTWGDAFRRSFWLNFKAKSFPRLNCLFSTFFNLESTLKRIRLEIRLGWGNNSLLVFHVKC